MLFIYYPPCSTCQKAKKWLEEKGVAYTERHIKDENPTYEEWRPKVDEQAAKIRKGEISAKEAAKTMDKLVTDALNGN